MTTANKMIESSEKDCICRTAYFCYLDDSMTAYVVVRGSVSPCLTKVWHYPLVLGAGAFQNCQDPMLGPKGATWIYASICRSLTAPSYRIRPRRMCEIQPRMGSGTSLPKSILHLRPLPPVTLNLPAVLRSLNYVPLKKRDSPFLLLSASCFWASSHGATRLQVSLPEVDSTSMELNEELSRAKARVRGLEVAHRFMADRQIFQ
jgi:hypothetical protein